MFGGGGIERRLRRELQKRQHFSVILPLVTPLDPPDPRDVIDGVRAVVAHSGATVESHPLMRGAAKGKGGLLGSMLGSGSPASSRNDVFLVISEIALWIAIRGEPMEHRGDIGRFVNPETWPKGVEALADHGAYVEVCDLGLLGRQPMAAADAAFNRAVAVTATAAAMARMAPPLGLLWHPARSAIPPQSFRDQFARVLAGQAPLELWMRWFFLRGNAGQNDGIITRGLTSFVGREIEVRPSLRSEKEALAIAFAAASILIDHGQPLRHDERREILPGMPVSIRHGTSRARSGLPVYEITPLGGASARSASAQ